MGVMQYPFVRTSQTAEDLMSAMRTEDSLSPLYNFDVFAENIDTHYAFFKRNEIDWPQLQRRQRSKLSESSSEADLYRVLEETMELLKDNHAYLELHYVLVGKPHNTRLDLLQGHW